MEVSPGEQHGHIGSVGRPLWQLFGDKEMTWEMMTGVLGEMTRA